MAVTTTGAKAAAANPAMPMTTVVLCLAQPDIRYAGGDPESKDSWVDMYLYIAKENNDGSPLEFKEVGVQRPAHLPITFISFQLASLSHSISGILYFCFPCRHSPLQNSAV